MQSQTATIYQFNHLLQELQPKVQVFRNQIVESESDFLDFFKNFLKVDGFDFFENESCITVKLKVGKTSRPLVAVKFSISETKTKNDDIVNLITIIGILSFVRNNPALFSNNLLIVVEKSTFGSEFFLEDELLDGLDLVIALDSNPSVENDCIAFKKGTLIPAGYDFLIRMFSAFSSNSRSESTVDLFALAAQTITALSQVATRKLDPLHPVHVSFKSIDTTPGQLSREIAITGTIGALDDTVGMQMISIMESTLNAITKSTDCSYDFSFDKIQQIFQNDADYGPLLLKWSQEILGKTKVQNLEHLNKNFDRWSSFFREFPTVIIHVSGLDSINRPNLIPTLQLHKIDLISGAATRVICWTLIQI